MPGWRRDRRRVPVLALVLLLHAAGLLQWLAQAPARPGPPEAPRVAVRLLPRHGPSLRPAAATPAPPSAPTPRVRAARPRRAPTPASTTVPGAVPMDPRPAADTAAAPASAPGPTAGLDPEATARAIRESARRPGLAALAGRFGPTERTPEQRLGEGIAQGARGDCLKGEYLGAGMGVLSLPFLAAAAWRDQCRH